MVLLPMLKHSQYKESHRPYRLGDLELTLVQLLRHLLKCTDPGPLIRKQTTSRSPRALQRKMSIKKAMPGWSSRLRIPSEQDQRANPPELPSPILTSSSNAPEIIITQDTPSRIIGQIDDQPIQIHYQRSRMNRRTTRKLVEKGLRRCREIKIKPLRKTVISQP